jgi:hypothetical protein
LGKNDSNSSLPFSPTIQVLSIDPDQLEDPSNLSVQDAFKNSSENETKDSSEINIDNSSKLFQDLDYFDYPDFNCSETSSSILPEEIRTFLDSISLIFTNNLPFYRLFLTELFKISSKETTQCIYLKFTILFYFLKLVKMTNGLQFEKENIFFDFFFNLSQNSNSNSSIFNSLSSSSKLNVLRNEFID